MIKKLSKTLTMMELSFQCKKKILTGLKWKITYGTTALAMKIGWFFPIYFSNQTFGDSMNFLLVIDDDSQWRHWITPVYFNSVTKRVINHRFRLKSFFQ